MNFKQKTLQIAKRNVAGAETAMKLGRKSRLNMWQNFKALYDAVRDAALSVGTGLDYITTTLQ